MSPQAQTLDDLMQSSGAMPAAPQAAPVPMPAPVPGDTPIGSAIHMGEALGAEQAVQAQQQPPPQPTAPPNTGQPIDTGNTLDSLMRSNGALPVYKAPNKTDEQGHSVVDDISTAWNRANTPLVPQIADAAHAIADHLDAPKLNRSETEARIRGFLSGSITGAGDVLSGFTSPVGIALMLSGLGGDSTAAKSIPALKSLLDLPAVQVAQRAVQAGTGAAFAGHGAYRVATDPTMAGKAQGALEAATGALGVASSVPRPRFVNPNPAEAAAVQAGQAAGVPVDLATATGNKAVRGAQFLADRSLGGSLVAAPAEERAAGAFKTWGDQLSDQARGGSVTAEQAGQGVRDALTSKLQAHSDLADHTYDTLRQLEEDPSNRVDVPTSPAPVDGLSSDTKGQLRRIVHELDAMPYTKRLLEPTKYGGSLQHVEGTGGAGADVYHDIVGETGPSRGFVQRQLEEYLGGGPQTAVVKQALDVADQRNSGKGGQTISRPELPPSAMDIPTRLESSRVTSQDMGLPVDLSGPKAALKPLYDQMQRQMPVTQQQSSAGLKAIHNILTGPDYAPLSQIDRDLSAIKSIARSQGGLAKMAVSRLDAAVQTAAANGGDRVLQTLQQGRGATSAKYATQNLIDALPGGKMEEPVAVFRAATAPKDAGIEFLRTVRQQVPGALPQIARAKLEDLVGMKPDKAFAEWQNLGAQTKSILFPQAGHAQALDHFFLLQQRMATNPNRSGTAYVAALGAQGAAFWTNPVASLAGQVGAAGLSTMLHSPAVTKALTRVVSVSAAPSTAFAVRAAALASLARAARDAGVPLGLPAAAQGQPGQTP